MRGLVLLFLLLLLAQSSSASWEGGTLESLAVRDAILVGDRAILQVLEMDEGVVPELDLQAEQLHLEAWMKKDDVNVAGQVTYTDGPNTTREVTVWNDARVTVSDARADVMLFLHGASEVRVEDHRMVVSGHPRDSVTEASASQHFHRTPTTLPIPSLHEVGAASGVLTARGNFSLSIHEWDLLVQNATHSESYWSGYRETNGTVLPLTTGNQNQRLYLNVTNGVLRLPLAGLHVRDFFVAGTSLQAASAVLDLASRDSPLNLAGPLHFGLEPVSDGSFRGRLLDEQESPPAQSNAAPGESSAPLVAAADPAGSAWTSILVAVAALVVVALVSRRLLRLLRLRRARDDGDYGRVAAGAGLEDSRRFGAEVVVARVVCMVKTGQFNAAASLLERRGAQLAPAVSAYLWACVHAGSGAVEEARDAVARSVLADPAMAIEVAANKSLRRFLADVGEGGYS